MLATNTEVIGDAVDFGRATVNLDTIAAILNGLEYRLADKLEDILGGGSCNRETLARIFEYALFLGEKEKIVRDSELALVSERIARGEVLKN